MIVPLRLDALAAVRLGGQIQAVAEHLQQPLLEQAQRRLERRPGAQQGERAVIVIEQQGERIVARREPDEQLVQVERRQQTLGRQRGVVPGALRSGELRRLAPPAP